MKRLSDLEVAGGARILGVLSAVASGQPLRLGDVGVGAGKIAAGDDARATGNEKTTNKNTSNGYAGLDAAGRVLSSTIPLVGLYLLMGRFGSGADGPITISSDYIMTRDMHWTDVDIVGSAKLVTAGFKPHARGRVVVTTTAPWAITPNSPAPGLSGAGGTSVAANAPGGGTATPSQTTGGSGGGGAGGAGGVTVGTGGTVASAVTTGHGGESGQSGTGGAGSGGNGGNATSVRGTSFGPQIAGGGFTVEAPDDTWLRGVVLMIGGAGGGGGGGGGGNGTSGGGAGGGGGASGPVLDAAFFEVDVSGYSGVLMSVKGGNGGNGASLPFAPATVDRGGGGGGSGGGGGCIRLVVGAIIGSLVDALQADGGDGGNGGDGNGTGRGGRGGGGGQPGRVTLFHLGATGAAPIRGVVIPAVVAPAAPVVNAGGLGSVGGTCRLSLP